MGEGEGKDGASARRRGRGNRGSRAGTDAARAAIILERRSTGESLASIAAGLGIKAETASKILAAELQSRSIVSTAEARHLRQLELDRVDRWARTMERRYAQNGDPKAAEMLLRMQARRLALSGIRIDLAEPEAGRGRATLDPGHVGQGELPPFLQATLARAAALGGALGYAAGLAQGGATLALPSGDDVQSRATGEQEAILIEQVDNRQPALDPANQATTGADSQEPALPTMGACPIPAPAMAETIDDSRDTGST